MWKTIGLAAVALAFSIVPPALAQEPFSGYGDGMWNKLYVGVHAGGASGGDSDWLFLQSGQRTSPGLDTGAELGGQVGIMRQFGPVVAGAEVSYSGMDDVDGTAPCPNAIFNCSNSIDNLLLVNGRLGYAFGPLLLYGTGGWARAHVELSSNVPHHVDGNASGWDAGGGIEYQFAPNVSLAVQYVHVDLGNKQYELGHGGVDLLASQDFNVVEARLNLLLNTP